MNRVTELATLAEQTLRRNDLGGYTIPNQNIYPFQWNWDAGITALGWLRIDEARAWQELDTLFKGQWQDGMVPHIIFHAPSDAYFPGPEQWGVNHNPPTSSISQPPLLSTMVRLMVEQAQDQPLAQQRARALLPKLFANHLWWYSKRDPQQLGFVSSYHPWESGMDNSPAWDEAMAATPGTTRPYQRRDLNHVDAGQRPLQSQYDRFVYLLDFFREQQFDAQAIYDKSPYRVQDIGLNAVLHRATLDLLALAEQLADADQFTAERAELQAAVQRAEQARDHFWLAEKNCFVCRDLNRDCQIPIATTGGLLALYGRLASPAQAAQIAEKMKFWLEEGPFGVASTCPDETGFDPDRYWRGPSWLHINWMIADGLAHYGYSQLADQVSGAAKRTIEQSGYWEYYNPLTGEGRGGADFSWTAAIALFWLL